MENKLTEIFEAVEKFIKDIIEINNEQMLKIMYQLLLSSSLLTLYLDKKGIIGTDYNAFIDQNKTMMSNVLLKESEDMLKTIKKTKEEMKNG